MTLLFERPAELKGELDGLNYFIDMFFHWLFTNTADANKIKTIKKANEILKPELFSVHPEIRKFVQVQERRQFSTGEIH